MHRFSETLDHTGWSESHSQAVTFDLESSLSGIGDNLHIPSLLTSIHVLYSEQRGLSVYLSFTLSDQVSIQPWTKRVITNTQQISTSHVWLLKRAPTSDCVFIPQICYLYIRNSSNNAVCVTAGSHQVCPQVFHRKDLINIVSFGNIKGFFFFTFHSECLAPLCSQEIAISGTRQNAPPSRVNFPRQWCYLPQSESWASSPPCLLARRLFVDANWRKLLMPAWSIWWLKGGVVFHTSPLLFSKASGATVPLARVEVGRSFLMTKMKEQPPQPQRAYYLFHLCRCLHIA